MAAVMHRVDRPRKGKSAAPTTDEAESSAPPAFAEGSPRYYDPGTRISPARVSDCIDRIFGDAPRLGSTT